MSKHMLPAGASALAGVSHPTSCAFGGTDLCTLYVTSCSVDTTVDKSAQPWPEEPDAGAIFALEVLSSACLLTSHCCWHLPARPDGKCISALYRVSQVDCPGVPVEPCRL